MSVLPAVIVVGVGGAIGAICRVGLGYYVMNVARSSFPWGTMVVNLAGCFLIGLLWSVFDHYGLSNQLKLLVISGGLGAFTTFSTFGLEAIHLFSSGQVKLGVIYLVVSNVGGLVLVALGFGVSRLVLS